MQPRGTNTVDCSVVTDKRRSSRDWRGVRDVSKAGARTRLPRPSAEVAELLLAAARHVVAAHCELDEVAARGAALPALFLPEFEHRIVRVVRTGAAGVRGELAATASLRVTGWRSASDRAGRFCGRTEERGACGDVAVDAVLDAELATLLLV